MDLIREDSTHVEAYNEGLVVFLYDDAQTDMIREASPSILEGFGEQDVADPTLARLAAEGALVVFELEQDDELSIELAVGEPLTADELAGGRWCRTQRARLNLPSGVLCIEGYNNLQFDPDPMDEEPGARITVPPGYYAMSLYRSDIFAYEESETDAPYAWQVITLTPEQGPSVELEGPMLRFPV